MEYPIIIITMLISLIIMCYFSRNKDGLPTNWPLLGMFPTILKNFDRMHEFCIEVLEKTERTTFHAKGPWFTDMNLLVTVDPANLNHILGKKSENYVKGDKFNEIFEVPFGDGILNSNAALWSYHRKLGLSFFNNTNFKYLLVNITCQKVQNFLVPFLEHALENAIEIDLQDIFLRFMYHTMCIVTMDHDPKSLSMDLSSFPLIEAVVSLSDGVVYRHALPTCLWKSLRWLNVGRERKFNQASKILDDFIYSIIKSKREERKRKKKSKLGDEVSTDLLTLLIDEEENSKVPVGHSGDKFLRDSIANFFLAGAESTSNALSWFFYLLSKNPKVRDKIKEELNASKITIMEDQDGIVVGWFDAIDKLIYLHAAICESLRLYPRVSFNSKEAIEADTLPSGHRVEPSMQIIFNLFAMGRMKSIWGDDCNEFKPERWISEDGTIKHEPSYKFSVFSSGARSCIGKQMVFVQMKVIVAIVIQTYRIEVIGKDHVPRFSLILKMKDDLKAKVLRPYY